MHRLIMNTPEGMDTDHINRKPLDNRRINLRVCTHGDNMQNLGRRKDNTSGYTGVDWYKNRSWRVRVNVDKKPLVIGYFKNFDEAVEARMAVRAEA